MEREPQTPWEFAEQKEAQEVARVVTDYLNHHHNLGRVTDALGCEHRTLQQAFTKLCLYWFKHLSELPDNWYDARNEYSVQVAKRIRRELESDLGSAWCHTPFI